MHRHPSASRTAGFRGSLALALMFIADALLQSRPTTTHAGRLAQLVTATQTPLATQTGALVFIASSSAASPTLARLAPAALRETFSPERATPPEALTPVGQATAFPPGCEVAGMHAAPGGPGWPWSCGAPTDTPA